MNGSASVGFQASACRRRRLARARCLTCLIHSGTSSRTVWRFRGGGHGWDARLAAVRWEPRCTSCRRGALPENILRSLRGSVGDTRVAYPDVLHVEVRDSRGDLWRLATQDAEWSPSDPGQLVGCSIDDVAIDGETGELHCRLSDGSALDIRPAAIDAEEGLVVVVAMKRSGVLMRHRNPCLGMRSTLNTSFIAGVSRAESIPSTPRDGIVSLPCH
jgi:hypothetical protein